jgi:putative lipoprotein
MTFKKIYGLILGVVAVGLASCSSDLNNEGNTPINPTKTAKRSLTLSANNATTRSYISLQDGNQWRKGDRFIVYNLTSPAGTDELVAKGDGANTLLKGDVTCADNNEIAVFFPYQNSAGVGNQHKVDISLNRSNLSENGQVVNRTQDGKLENLKYFDFSYGTTRVRTTPGSNNVTGNVQMKKQYAVLRLKFKADGQELKNLKKLTISNVITSGIFDMSRGQLTEKQKGDITITPSAPLDSFVVAVFPEEHFQPTFTVVGSDNKTYRFSVGVDLPIANADYAPYVVAVKEIAPYIEIGGVKWGKYNLQYTPNSTTAGWKDGYHLAKNPWDYFYTAKCGYPLTESVLDDRVTTFDGKWDHFRWGDIVKAHDYSVVSNGNYSLWNKVGDINGQFNSDKTLGDLAAYASNGKWQMPTAQQFSDMMSKTAESIGYFVDDNENTIYGVLFDPNVPQSKKGWILNKDGNTYKKSNSITTAISRDDVLRKFTKADFENALFFPMAGMYNEYGQSHLAKPGSQGAYWLATGGDATTAAAFVPYVSERNQIFAGYTKSAKNPKRAMYSIRPIYVGQ